MQPMESQPLPVDPAPERGTQPLFVASAAVQNLEPPKANGRTQAIPIPTLAFPAASEPTQAMPIGRPSPPPVPAPVRSRALPWLLGGGAGLLCLAAAGMLWLRPDWFGSPRATPPLDPPTEEVPLVLRPYLAQAQTGDTRAMRMLGARYTYGLDVPRDPLLGRRWYQKAADAGDATAKAELAQLNR